MKLQNVFVIFFNLLNTFSSNLKLSSPAIQQVTQPVDHGEGPFWDGRNNLLYYVNIHSGEIYCYDFETDKVRSIKLNGDVTPVIPSRNDPKILVIGLNRSVVAVEWDGKHQPGSYKSLTTVSNQFPTSRMNDGKADKEGRLWFGTMGFENASGVVPNEGVLYKITCENLNSPQVMIAPVNVSNGMAWNKANNKFYYIDTLSFRVLEYNYDNKKGEISQPRVAFDVMQQSLVTGLPDGMTIDVEDKLWIAVNNGGCVVRVNPKNGKILKIVALPAVSVTSVAWGGPKLDILIVTTSRFNLSPEQRKQQPAAGSVFAISGLGTKGLPAFTANIANAAHTKHCA